MGGQRRDDGGRIDQLGLGRSPSRARQVGGPAAPGPRAAGAPGPTGALARDVRPWVPSLGPCRHTLFRERSWRRFLLERSPMNATGLCSPLNVLPRTLPVKTLPRMCPLGASPERPREGNDRAALRSHAQVGQQGTANRGVTGHKARGEKGLLSS